MMNEKKNNSLLIIAILLTAGVLLIVSYWQFDFFTPEKKVDDFDRVPNFHLETRDGDEASFAYFLGKPLVILSWSVACENCGAYISLFDSKVRQQQANIQFIAINRGNDKSSIQKFFVEHNIRQSMTVLLDPNDTFFQSVHGSSMPEVFLVGTDGYIVKRLSGILTEEQIESEIELFMQ